MKFESGLERTSFPVLHLINVEWMDEVIRFREATWDELPHRSWRKGGKV